MTVINDNDLLNPNDLASADSTNEITGDSSQSGIDTQSVNLSHYLDAIRVVMVNTTLPANIGSAARAMLTMGLTQLTVVEPKHPIDDSSIAHAAGAKRVLANCVMTDTLDEAIQDCQLVFAASSRGRHLPRPVITPTQAAHLIASHIDQQSKNMALSASAAITSTATTPRIAVLFGREDRGLTNEELALADYHIQIDANPDYPVLNVASAVQVIASFFYSHFSGVVDKFNTDRVDNDNDSDIDGAITDATDSHHVDTDADKILQLMLRQVWDEPAITQAQKQKLEKRIIELMQRLTLVGSTEPESLRDLPSRLLRLLSRLQLDQKEYELLNAIIAKLLLKLP